MAAASSYLVLKPCPVDVDGERLTLDPGDLVPNGRVPAEAVADWPVDRMCRFGYLAAADGSVGSLADLPEETLLEHLEKTVSPEAVLARFEDGHLVAELRRRGLLPDAEPTPDEDELAAKAAEAGAADPGGEAAGEGGAGADAPPPAVPAEDPAEPDAKTEPESEPESKSAPERKPKPAKAKKPAAKSAAKKPTAKKTSNKTTSKE